MRRLWRNPTLLYRWGLAGMAQAAASTPWVILLYLISDIPGWIDGLPGIWILLIAYLGAVLWESALHSASRPVRMLSMAVGMAGSYLLAYWGLPAALRPLSPLMPNLAMALLPASGYLWYQGIRQRTEGIGYGHVFARFIRQSLSLVAGLLLLLFLGYTREHPVRLMLYWSLFLLFGAGLPLVALTRGRALQMQQAAAGEEGSGGESVSSRLVWVVAILIGIAVLIAQWLSVEQIIAALLPVIRLVGRPIAWLTDAALLILVYLFTFLHWLLSPFWRLLRREAPEADLNLGMGKPSPLEELQQVTAATDWVPYVKAALLVGSMIGLMLMLYRLSRTKQPAEGEWDEKRINLGVWHGLLADLKELFRNLHRPAAARQSAPDVAGMTRSTSQILFCRLQAWGALMGRARRLAETPLQYAVALQALHPKAEGAVTAVTAVYNQDRYSPSPPGEEAVKKAEAAFGQLCPEPGIEFGLHK